MRTVDEQRLRHVEALVYSLPLFTMLASIDGRVELVNESGRALIGLSESLDVTTLTTADLFLGGTPPALLELGRRAAGAGDSDGGPGDGSDRSVLAVGSTWSGSSELRDRRTGRGIPLEVVSFVLGDPSTGEPTGVAVLERGPPDSPDPVRAGVASQLGADVVAVVTPDALLVGPSPTLADLLGGPVPQPGADLLGFVHPDDRGGLREVLGRFQTAPAEPVQTVFRLGPVDGAWRHVEATVQDLRRDPLIKGLLLVARDVTERQRIIAALQSEAATLGLIARGTPIADVVEHVSAAMTSEAGAAGGAVLLREEAPTGPVLRPVAVAGRALDAVLDQADLDDAGSPCSLAARTGSPVVLAQGDVSGDFPSCRQLIDPSTSASIVAAPVRSLSGRGALGVVAVSFATPAPGAPFSRDRTGTEIVAALERAATLVAIAVEHSLSERRLAYEATHDQLTGLLNRALLLDRLALAIGRARRDPSIVPVVLFIDLDRLKLLNDSLGHECGDELLVVIADRLRSMFRSSDAVARFGGDEYVVVAEIANGESAPTEIAERLLENLAEPVQIAGREIVPSASMGIAVATGYDVPQDVIRDADTAMYRAKESGGGTYRLFDPEMGARALARLELARAIRAGVERGEFALRYQPVVDLRNGEVTGLEALLRWDRPGRGLVEPEEFLAAAEESGLIVPIGEAVLAQSAAAVSSMPAVAGASGGSPRTLSVNISARQLTAPGLLEAVEAAVAALGEWRLCLELTESVLLADGPANRASIDALARSGALLSVDDFGTGHFSLRHLSALPVSTLKIDRSIVGGLGLEASAAAIATAIIGLADGLGMRVVAEGVETRAQASLLRALGCHDAQGHFFHPPLSFEAARALLER